MDNGCMPSDAGENGCRPCQEHRITSNPSQPSRNMYSLFMREDWLIEIYSSYLTIFCILNKLKFYTLMPKTKLKHN